jgi:hypothetical protein
MRNFLKRLILVAAVLGAFVAPAAAQAVAVVPPTGNLVPASGFVGADDTDVALICSYTGTDAGGGEIAVAAGGDITFTVATVADATFECPVSGALGGVIDVSDAACDTLGEVVDIVNGKTTNSLTPTTGTDFKCVIIDGLRTDSSNDTLLTFSAATADYPNGKSLLFDSDVALTTSFAVLPLEARSLPFYWRARGVLAADPFLNWTGVVGYVWEDTGTCTGADTTRVIAENYSGTKQQTLFRQPSNTTTPVTWDFSRFPIFGPQGSKVVVRETCVTSFATGLLHVYGYVVTANRP